MLKLVVHLRAEMFQTGICNMGSIIRECMPQIKILSLFGSKCINVNVYVYINTHKENQFPNTAITKTRTFFSGAIKLKR